MDANDDGAVDLSEFTNTDRLKEADTNGDGETDPIETSLEWGVRSLGKRVAVKSDGKNTAEAIADVFPAYDDDGGLMIVLTPEG